MTKGYSVLNYTRLSCAYSNSQISSRHLFLRLEIVMARLYRGNASA